MRRIFPNSLILILCLSFAAALPYPRAARAATCDAWIAQAVSVEGIVEVQRAGETQWQTIKLADTFCPGDTLMSALWLVSVARPRASTSRAL